MKIIGIAGFKNSGKTTLIVDLIRELRSRGLRVATIKHAHHEFDIDHPGKDSYQHRKAGAAEVIVASDLRLAHVLELADSRPPELQELISRLSKPDVVLIEGYKCGSHPKLELRRAEAPAPELAADDSQVRAIIADYELTDAAVPVLSRDDVPGIVDFMLACE